MKGDVSVLDRIEKRDNRHARLTNSLKRRLDRRNRGLKLEQLPVIATGPTLVPVSYSENCNIVAHENLDTARQKLLLARGSAGKRTFLISDVVDGFEDVMALIVGFRRRDDMDMDMDLLCECLGGSRGSQRLSQSNVLLMRTEADLPEVGGASRNIVVYKMHVDNGMFVFYVSMADDNVAASQPFSLGLDRSTYTRIQTETARMFSISLEQPRPCAS